ncbi:MAG: PQQ-binding-like beta-propeller repeat protein [Pseudomonadota bacterium]
MSYITRRTLLASAAGFAVTSCGRREVILPGQREDIRPAQELLEEFDNLPQLRIAGPSANTSWTHRNGNATHNFEHVGFSGPPSRIWSVNLGKGNTRRTRITADPIVAAGRIFAMDAVGQVSAISTSGTILWSVDLRPERDARDDISGGGLAFGANTLLASTGYGDVVALDPETGAEKWRQRFQASLTAAPAVDENTVVAVSVGNEAMGLNVANGRIRWRLTSGGSNTAVAGGGTPAIAGRLTVVPFPSGELVAVTTISGIRVWSSAVTGTRLGLARGVYAPVSGDPVIDGGQVIAANQAGRAASISLRNGARNWTVGEGSYSPVWMTENSVFVMTDQAKLKRLSRSNGSVLWSQDLPDKPNRRRVRSVYAHFGPVIAGGRIYVASSDGAIRSFDPQNGTPLETVNLSSGAASHMAIAEGRLYVVTENGQLVAFQ